MVTGDFTGAWVTAKGCGGKDVLPAPLTGRAGAFPHQGLRHVNIPGTHCKVAEVFLVERGKVLFEAFFEGFWQCDDAVFSAFAVMNRDGALAEIEVLDSQPHGFHQAETAAIHDLRRKFPRSFHAGENGADFFASHHDGWAALATGGGEVIEGQLLDSKDVFNEEDHGIECLALGGLGDVAFEGEELEAGGDGGRAGGLRGLAEFLEAEADEAAIPVNVGFLGGDSAAFEPDGTAEGINEFDEFRFGIGFRWKTRGQDDQAS